MICVMMCEIYTCHDVHRKRGILGLEGGLNKNERDSSGIDLY